MSNQQNETGLTLVRIIAIVIAVMVVGCFVCVTGLFVIGLLTGDDAHRIRIDSDAYQRSEIGHPDPGLLARKDRPDQRPGEAVSTIVASARRTMN